MQIHSSQKETYLFKIHRFFLVTLGQGQWPWVTPNFSFCQFLFQPECSLVIPNSWPICMEVNEDFAILWFSRTDLYSDYWVYRENHLRFLDGVFCKLLPGTLKLLGVTQGHWPWPRVTRRNGWIKGTFLFQKSVQRSHIGRPPFQGSDLGVPYLHHTPNLTRTI